MSEGPPAVRFHLPRQADASQGIIADGATKAINPDFAVDTCNGQVRS